MKYTRYDMKRKKNNSLAFVVVFLSTLVFAVVIGTVISKLFFNNNLKEVIPKSEDKITDAAKKEDKKKVVRYIVVQCGVFGKNENAESVKKNLSVYGNAFTVLDEKGTRVLLGIYKEEQGLKTMKILSEKSIDNSKITFEINILNNNACDEQVAAIIDAELDVLTSLADSNTKSIDTKELKKWCSLEIKEVDKKSTNINVLNELKAHISTLPDELGKDKASECYIFLYNILKKLTEK
ncbi:hypothetical protein M2651_04895 [Clostridium sp. SYSU_GA19001]|uniref:hypothetical protein n=1 Tax=Clostridium caldaquaticum TaxID=2940653 RepID=UPI0020777E32|nr:hypothetical protein [Clostridium caldaquaticum]MCM8710361.1 hypothetical protein [Clostridium caldaquaticum]